MSSMSTASLSSSVTTNVSANRMQSVDWIGWALILISVAIWGVGAFAGLPASVLAFTGIGMAAAAYGLVHPTIGLFGISILCLMDPLIKFILAEEYSVPFSLVNYWLAGVVFLYLPFVLRLRAVSVVVWFLFVTLMVIQLFHSADVAEGIVDIVASLSFLGVLIYFVRTGYDARLWFWLGVVCGIMGAVGSVMFYLVEREFILERANIFCSFPAAAIWMICLAVRTVDRRPSLQLLFVCLAWVNLIAVVFTQSRGGLLIAAFGFGFVLVRIASMQLKVVLVSTGILLVSTVLLFSPDTFDSSFKRVERLFDSSESLRSRTSGRSDLLLGCYYIAKDKPAGVGTGGFQDAWIKLNLRGALSGFHSGVEIKGGAHAAWGKTLAENGFLGLALHVTFVMSFAVVGLLSRNRDMLLYGLLATTALSVTQLSREFSDLSVWVVVAGTCIILYGNDHMAALYRSLGRRPSATATESTSASA